MVEHSHGRFKQTLRVNEEARNNAAGEVRLDCLFSCRPLKPLNPSLGTFSSDVS